MALDILIGTQWGDEGKGRFTDLLAARVNYVARFNGGDNAGHTVTVADQIFKLHLIPSGIIHPHTTCLLGDGMVINPEVLLQEMDTLRQAGVEVNPHRLQVSWKAHIITPAHRALDGALEKGRGQAALGTTQRGIGPAYTDKASRRGLRAAAMRDPDSFAQAVRDHMVRSAEILRLVYGMDPPDIEEAVDRYRGFAHQLGPFLSDTGSTLNEALHQGESVLAEGAQGTLLDLDHGTYPYVTSSNPTAAGALLGLGLGPLQVSRVIGVTKAFQSRVGEGPFPTELSGTIAETLRGTGENPWDEYGTTTGRPRRVGWLDGVLLRYAVRINGTTELALTKLDILTGLQPLQLCTAYRINGEDHELPPGDLSRLGEVEPRYETLEGWQEDLRQVRSWSELPPCARGYVRRIEALAGIPIRWISVGPERDQVVERES